MTKHACIQRAIWVVSGLQNNSKILITAIVSAKWLLYNLSHHLETFMNFTRERLAENKLSTKHHGTRDTQQAAKQNSYSQLIGLQEAVGYPHHVPLGQIIFLSPLL